MATNLINLADTARENARLGAIPNYPPATNARFAGQAPMTEPVPQNYPRMQAPGLTNPADIARENARLGAIRNRPPLPSFDPIGGKRTLRMTAGDGSVIPLDQYSTAKYGEQPTSAVVETSERSGSGMNMMDEAAVSQPSTKAGSRAFFDYTTPRVPTGVVTPFRADETAAASTPGPRGSIPNDLPVPIPPRIESQYAKVGGEGGLSLAQRGDPRGGQLVPAGVDLSKVKSADAAPVAAAPAVGNYDTSNFDYRNRVQGGGRAGEQMTMNYGPAYGDTRVTATADKTGRFNSFSDMPAMPAAPAAATAPAGGGGTFRGAAADVSPGDWNAHVAGVSAGAGGYPRPVGGDVSGGYTTTPNTPTGVGGFAQPYSLTGGQPSPGMINIGPGGADPYGINADIAASRQRIANYRSKPGNVLNNMFAAGEQKRLNKMVESGINVGQLGVQRGQLGVAQGNLGVNQGNLGVAQGNLGVAQGMLGVHQKEVDIRGRTLGLDQRKFAFEQRKHETDPKRYAESLIANAMKTNTREAYDLANAWAGKHGYIVAQGALGPEIRHPHEIPPGGIGAGTGQSPQLQGPNFNNPLYQSRYISREEE